MQGDISVLTTRRHSMKIIPSPLEESSVATVFNVLRDLKSPNATFTDVARRYGISTTSAINIFDRHVHISRRQLPECLALDEVYAFKSHDSDYVCVIVDYLDKKIVDVLPSRRKYDLLNYFMLIPLEERKKVKYVSFDMWETYRIVTKHVFPEACCIADHLCKALHKWSYVKQIVM